MAGNIADIRNDYAKKKLSEKKADPDPIKQFSKWWKQALASKIPEPNAMTLATSSPDGIPSARIVLLKEFSSDGFIFFTNYESFKGQQLRDNPKACLVFFWKEVERQVRITGLVTKITDEANDSYFHSRPKGSQLGAVVSPQSQAIDSWEWLDKKVKELKKKVKGSTIIRPPHWGGYLVKPVTIEFWQGRPRRLHDRLQYSLEEDGSWKMERLAP